MADINKLGLYLVVDFDWPQPFKPEFGVAAQELHNAVQDQSWIKEIAAASGGIGGGQSSIWVFWLEDYAALDKLFNDENEAVGNAYRAFFTSMDSVQDKIREEVRFR